MDYNRQHNIDTKVVRIFNTYGPKMAADDGRVVSNFINQALRGEDITIYGEGLQTRSFQYIDDLVNALIAMMNSNEIGPINLGNPEELTVLDLAEIVLSMIRSQSKIVFSDLPSDDPRQRKPDIEKAQKCLNWSPKIPLHIGLQKTIDYFKEMS